MFLGEWFDGYSEFHLSQDSGNHKKRIDVWMDRGSHVTLSDKQAFELYAQASRILTLYYDVSTFECISAWHHGAGDFVIKLEGERLKTKLITVRCYDSFFQDSKKQLSPFTQAQRIMYLLLLFLLKLK